MQIAALSKNTPLQKHKTALKLRTTSALKTYYRWMKDLKSEETINEKDATNFRTSSFWVDAQGNVICRNNNAIALVLHNLLKAISKYYPHLYASNTRRF